ncbi:hypothetical protein KC347_g139 [Hortaea werneckii]|nr:hypothetical protein KC347_g139 [Hortaea werneckii]
MTAIRCDVRNLIVAYSIRIQTHMLSERLDVDRLQVVSVGGIETWDRVIGEPSSAFTIASPRSTIRLCSSNDFTKCKRGISIRPISYVRYDTTRILLLSMANERAGQTVRHCVIFRISSLRAGNVGPYLMLYITLVPQPAIPSGEHSGAIQLGSRHAELVGMASHLAFVTFAAAYMLRPAFAKEPFTFCTEASCSDCPISVTSAGTGYPACVMTFSHRAAAGQQLLAGSGWAPYIDIPEQELTGGLHSPNCQVIVKSPADTTLQGCGYEVANFAQPACATLNLDTTFMVQFCCGTGDCQSAGAGIKRSAKFERDIASSSGGGGLYLKDVNGTVIQPVKVGEVEATASGTGEEKRDPAPESVFARSNCEEGSWVADPNRDDYTRPADNTQVVLTGVSGPQTVKITTTRSQSWTSTLGASVGIEDIFSLGLSFEQSFTKEISDSTSRSFQVQDAVSTATCNGGQVSGEVCTPYKDGSGKLAGIYGLIITS